MKLCTITHNKENRKKFSAEHQEDSKGLYCTICGQDWIEAESRKTPLTDSAEHKSGYGDLIVKSSDSRAIELRLNECVEALEELEYHTALSTRCFKAITNARKPL